MIKRLGLVILAILLISILITSFSYSRFRSEKLFSLESNSILVETSVGPIEYQIVGDTGPIVLYLHGTPGGYNQSTSIKGYRVLAPSRPGYLRTPINVGRTPAEQADAYVALLDTLDIDSVIVMGASGGGSSAISFAALYPERTKGLIAMEVVSQTLNQGGEPPFFLQSDFLLWATLSTIEKFSGEEGVINLVIAPQNRQRVLNDPNKINRTMGLVWSVWPVSQHLTGQQNDTGQWKLLDLPSEKVTAPTLIIHGTADNNVPFAQSEILVQEIPHAIFHVIEGGDHYMSLSHSEEINAAIEKFLEALQPTS